jgi:hypothetical protein
LHFLLKQNRNEKKFKKKYKKIPTTYVYIYIYVKQRFHIFLINTIDNFIDKTVKCRNIIENPVI